MDGLGYKDRRVVVTGCASGIGRATAELLIAQGAEVVGLDIAASDLALAAFHRLDLREPAAIAATAEAVGARVDALFNCAGVPPGPSGLDVLKVNFIGARELTRLLLARMGEGGAVVSVASNGGLGWSERVPLLSGFADTPSFKSAVDWCEGRSEAAASPYAFSKQALIVWTLLESSRTIARGVRMNCTTPGTVQTPMLEEIAKTTPPAMVDVMTRPIGRRSRPDEQAWPLLFLNSGAAAYVNGAALPVDGGFLAARTAGQLENLPEIGRK